MNQRGYFLCLLAICLTMAMLSSSSAYAESILARLADKAEELLFDTENVTITGNAYFYLEGKRFKTAEITYVQDGTNSLWQEKLYTPRIQRPDRETGFTIVANSENVYVMEPFTPGAYRQFLHNPQSTVLKDSLEARFTLSVLKEAAALAEEKIPQAVSSLDNEYIFELNRRQTPDLLNDALLMAGRFAAKRLYGIDYDDVTDQSLWDLTTTRDIMYQTRACEIQNLNIHFYTDEENRLTGAIGNIFLTLNYTELDQYMLTVIFTLSIGEYGTSTVKPFNPEDYHVVPWEQALLQIEESNQQKLEGITASALEAWKKAGFRQADRFILNQWSAEDGVFYLLFTDPEEDPEAAQWEYSIIHITEEGTVLFMSMEPLDRIQHWDEHAELIYSDIDQSCMDSICAFLTSVDSDLTFDDLILIAQYQIGDSLYMNLAIELSEPENKTLQTVLIVQLSPETRILHYDCIVNR